MRTRRHHPRAVAATGFLGLALVVTACDREERKFRVDNPSTDATTRVAVRLSPLEPGPTSAPAITPNGYEENAYAMAQGQTLYMAWNCNGCHAMGGGDIGPPLMDDQWRYGSRPEQVYSTLVQGRPNGMPAFGNKVSDQQLWQLTAYVRSMSGLVPKDAAPARSDHMTGPPPPHSTPATKPLDSEKPLSVQMPS